MNKEKACCFISEEYLSFFKETENILENQAETDKIKEQIIDLIENLGINCFLCGMEAGLELFCADFILSLKKKYNISLVCVIPFENQAENYSDFDHELYYNILSKCDKEVMLKRKRTVCCRKERDDFLIKNSQFIFLLSANKNHNLYFSKIKDCVAK